MGIKKGAQRLIREDKGFTLLEVCIAMSVLAIGILGVTSLQINAVRNVAVGNLYSRANALANQHVEYLKTIPLDLLEAWDGDDVENRASETESDRGDVQPIFRRQTSINIPAELDAANAEFCRLITVTVSWTGMSTSAGTRRIVTVSGLTRGEGI